MSDKKIAQDDVNLFKNESLIKTTFFSHEQTYTYIQI